MTEGSEISMFYDPMIAKLITHGATRDEAIDRQIAALDAFRIDGIGHNIDFLSALMQHPRFRSGAITTGFIAEEYPDGFRGAPASIDLQRKLAVIATTIDLERAERAAGISGQLADAIDIAGERIVLIDGERFEVSVGETVTVDGDEIEIDGEWGADNLILTARIDGERLSVGVVRIGTAWKLTAHGASHLVQVLPPHVAQYRHHMIDKIPPDMSRFLLAPMPGLLTHLHVAPGDRVEAGQPLAVVEAMKMENILRAERAGTVKSAHFVAGDSMAVDAAILEFE